MMKRRVEYKVNLENVDGDVVDVEIYSRKVSAFKRFSEIEHGFVERIVSKVDSAEMDILEEELIAEK